MPVTISKKPGKGGKFTVRTPGGMKSKGTSLKNAKAQERLLNAVEHSNWRPTGAPSRLAKKISGK